MRDSQQQLQVLVKQARDELFRIGSSLINEGCIEIWNLVQNIDNIRMSPLIDDCGNAFRGFCSQSGRLAGVMATMSKIGAVVCEATKSEDSVTDQKPTFDTQKLASNESLNREKLLKHQLGFYAEKFSWVGNQLQRLNEIEIAFIICDARVLHDHPDLVEAQAVKRRFAAATDHLEALSANWWSLAEETKEKANGYEEALVIHLSPYKLN